MHSLLKSNKAQFFILSVVAIVMIIFLVSKWIEPFTIVDTSSVALKNEFYTFDNIVEKFKQTANMSKNCEDLTYNLDEYKNFVENYAIQKNYNLQIYYTISSCSDSPFNAVVDVNSYLQSSDVQLNSNFHIKLP